MTNQGQSNCGAAPARIEWPAVSAGTDTTDALNTLPARQSFDVIVIGAGQAGLAVGHYLSRTGLRYAILDANERTGDAWRNRWDSLRLFTPAKLDALPGMPFPARGNYFPTKDEMADYLEAYAERFQLPVRNRARVDRLARRGARYVIETGPVELEADQVVVAMSGYQRPRIPGFANALSSEIVQMHSSNYRNLAQLQPGAVLLAGAGNSGADIAIEAARGGHPTSLAGPDTGHIPVRPEGFAGRNLFMPLIVSFVFHQVLTVRTPIGRKVRPQVLAKGAPLIRVKPEDLMEAGVRRFPRVIGVQSGRPLLEDGRTVDAANVIWCTGFRPGMEWIDLPVFDDAGEALHQSGVVENQPGLYFVGLKFLHAMSSSMIHGVARDASRVVNTIVERQCTASSSNALPLTVPAARPTISPSR